MKPVVMNPDCWQGFDFQRPPAACPDPDNRFGGRRWLTCVKIVRSINVIARKALRTKPKLRYRGKIGLLKLVHGEKDPLRTIVR